MAILKILNDNATDHVATSISKLFIDPTRGGSRTAASSKMERFVIIVNG